MSTPHDYALIRAADLGQLSEEIARMRQRLDSLNSTAADAPATFDYDGAAQYLQVSRRTVEAYTSQGLIAYCKVGDRTVFRREDLDAFLVKNRRPATWEESS